MLLWCVAAGIAFWSLLGGVGAAAAADGQSIGGVIKDTDGNGVPGVVLTVTAETGDFSETDTTNLKGAWLVELPDSGQYTVSLDTATLPAGVTLTDPERTSTSVNIFTGQTKKVLFPTGESTITIQSKYERVAQLSVDGLLFGLVVALGAVGLSLIFGTTGLTNFAHGELVTLGALVTYFFNNIAMLPFALSATLAVLVCGAFGYFQDRSFWRWLRRRGTGLIAMLVISIGLSIFLRYFYLFFFGGSTKQFREYSGQAGITIGAVDITPKAIVGAVVAILLLASTVAWLNLTRIGKASRAISDNPALASASGIDVDRVISVVWMVGSAMAAVSGILFSMANGVSWLEGAGLLLLIFAGVTLGGLGTAVGAIVGSLIVGVMIQVSTLFIPSELKNIGALGVLIVILLFRPQGILGRKERVG